MLSDTSSPHHSMSVIASASTALSTMMLEQKASSNDRESLGGMDSRARMPEVEGRNDKQKALTMMGGGTNRKN